ncbi:hypothetical protein EXN66_Car004920 [Channa argus]|uniref:Uncharacterized protein n=1 Tax=Channa argus TaxID=215402 RepID=A0A6G1PGW9_CHAAH|nr:hypothetical protein EXN66_Car004920 [Channa argus]
MYPCMAAKGTRSLVFIDYLNADNSSRMKCIEPLTDWIHLNAAKLIGCCFILKMDKDKIHTAEAT